MLKRIFLYFVRPLVVRLGEVAGRLDRVSRLTALGFLEVLRLTNDRFTELEADRDFALVANARTLTLLGETVDIVKMQGDLIRGLQAQIDELKANGGDDGDDTPPAANVLHGHFIRQPEPVERAA